MSAKKLKLIDDDIECENLKPMLLAVNTIPCSTVECERAFSAMNLISTNLRSHLTVDNLSNLMFIHINGPPLRMFKPRKHTETWLLYHRSADDTRSQKMDTAKSEQKIGKLKRYVGHQLHVVKNSEQWMVP